MPFNSLTFLFFLPITFLLYWALRRRGARVQNLLLIAAACVFYGWWDWRLLFLLFGVTLLNYLTGAAISQAPERLRKPYLIAGLLLNLGCLGVFKYYRFFAETLVFCLNRAGWSADLPLLHILLPVGVSFYMFQAMTYPLDIYRRQSEH